MSHVSSLKKFKNIIMLVILISAYINNEHDIQLYYMNYYKDIIKKYVTKCEILHVIDEFELRITNYNTTSHTTILSLRYEIY